MTDPIYHGLQDLAKTAFPKKCRNCGRIYHDADAFIAETKLLKKQQGKLQKNETQNAVMDVDLYRNCPCGSTLLDIFNNRRDISENGINRRNHFDKLMTMVESQYNVDRDTAREELLKIMKGEKSDVITHIIPSS